MKCPIDQTEMEEGVIDRGYWSSRFVGWGRAVKGIAKFFSGGSLVIAWKCPKCGKIDLFMDKEKK